MKTYNVYYYIKKNNSHRLLSEEVVANNKQEAFRLCEDLCQKKHKAHSFWKTLSAPVITDKGCEWHGLIFKNYYECNGRQYLN